MRFARSVTLVIFGVALTHHPLPAQVADSSAGVKAVLAAETAWWKGEVTGDTTAMAPFMAPDYVAVDPGQGALDRQGLLGMIGPTGAGDTEEVGNWRLMDYGTTIVAVADYITIHQGQTTRSMIFDTWINRGGKWQVVFGVIAALPGPAVGQ
ncbi:MAG: nuclear transport factor 2 family protein [Gemmatimonadales bacterium]